MIEIPESEIISQQATGILTGRRIKKVVGGTSPHKFAWYSGDPLDYPALLEGRKVEVVRGYGSYVDLILDDDVHLVVGDGTHLRYYGTEEQHPVKHQLLVVLDDGSFLVLTVAMYGAIYAFRGEFDNPYYQGSVHKLNPLHEQFDESYFENMIAGLKKDLSVKALLATEQRIPGLGNGVVQDILFNAGLHPRRKVSTLSDLNKTDLLYSMKGTLDRMVEQGGRDTEKDFLGNWGGYQVVLSKNTYKNPCPNCSHEIIREAYLGGNVYYCPVCQK